MSPVPQASASAEKGRGLGVVENRGTNLTFEGRNSFFCR
jgi:hypothetical protein